MVRETASDYRVLSGRGLQEFSLGTWAESIGDFLRFRSDNDVVAPQLHAAFGRLVAEAVATERLAVLDFTRSSDFKPLLHSLVGFLLWHSV
jgi:hypothetical protein